MGGDFFARLNSSRTNKSLAWLILLLVFCSFTFTSGGFERLFWGIFAYAGITLVYIYSRLTIDEIGLSLKNFKKGLFYSGSVILIIMVALLVFYFIDRQGFRDPRYHQSLLKALVASVVLLPLRTIFFEEFAFRGLLPALIFKLNPNRWFATIISSLLFGLWHIQSSRLINSYNLGGGFVVPKFVIILVVILFTAAAGVFLCELRWRSKSLMAPIIVHWFVNGFTVILAALSW